MNKIKNTLNEKNLILTRAKSAVLSRDFATAARLYKQLLKNDPSNVDYLKELGSIYGVPCLLLQCRAEKKMCSVRKKSAMMKQLHPLKQ